MGFRAADTLYCHPATTKVCDGIYLFTYRRGKKDGFEVYIM